MALRLRVQFIRIILVSSAALTCGVAALRASPSGEAAALPTLEQLKCSGDYRSLGQVDYSDVRTFDTPAAIIAGYAASPEGFRKGLSPSQTPNISYDNISIAKASKAVSAIDTSLGNPGLVMAFQKAANGDWRIDSIAECV